MLEHEGGAVGLAKLGSWRQYFCRPRRPAGFSFRMNPTPAPRARPAALAWPWLLLGALVYSALFVAYSWPLSREAGTAFVGYTQGDANQYVWNAYNFQRQVAAGANPFFTRLLLYPEGTWLWMHTYTPVLGLLNVLVRQEILAVNLGLLLSFGLSGVGAARLAGRWIAAARAVPAGGAGVCVFALQAGALARALPPAAHRHGAVLRHGLPFSFCL